MMRREILEHLVTTGMIEGKCSRGKQREKMLDKLTKRLEVERGTEALNATMDRCVEGHDRLCYRAQHLNDGECNFSNSCAT